MLIKDNKDYEVQTDFFLSSRKRYNVYLINQLDFMWHCFLMKKVYLILNQVDQITEIDGQYTRRVGNIDLVSNFSAGIGSGAGGL